MAFCRKCGAELGGGIRFCSSCGSPTVSPSANIPNQENVPRSQTGSSQGISIERSLVGSFQVEKKKSAFQSPIVIVAIAFFSLLFICFATGVVFNIVKEGKSEEQKKNISSAQIKSLGISYNQMMLYLSNYFEMKQSTPVKGQERWIGTKSDGLATLEIVGNHNNITQTSLVIGTPSDDWDVVVENTMITVRFLNNAVPEMGDEDTASWVGKSVAALYKGQTDKVERTCGDKKISMSLWVSESTICTTVKRM